MSNRKNSGFKILGIAGLVLVLAFMIGCRTIAKAERDGGGRYEPFYKQFTKMTAEERLADAEKRRGIFYRNRLELFIKEMPNAKKGGTVFLGDSITQGFPIDTVFEGKNVINRGIGGDIIEGVTYRLDICVEALKPKKIYLMIGVNNLCWANRPLEVFDAQFRTLLKDIRYAAPKADVTVLSALPITGKFADKNHLIPPYNELIKGITEEFEMEYVDLHPYFANENGELREDLTADGIHLNPDGYLTWLQVILDEDRFLEAAINLSEIWSSERMTSFPVSKIDPPASGEFPGNRGRNELVIYTPAYEKPTTGTNEWGTEVIVRNGTAVRVSGRDSEIPDDGFVVSGHGKASSWVSGSLKPGVRVKYDSNTICFDLPVGRELTVEYRIGDQKNRLFAYLQVIKKNGATKAQKNKALDILERIQKMQMNVKAVSDEDIKKLKKDIDNLIDV